MKEVRVIDEHITQAGKKYLEQWVADEEEVADNGGWGYPEYMECFLNKEEYAALMGYFDAYIRPTKDLERYIKLQQFRLTSLGGQLYKTTKEVVELSKKMQSYMLLFVTRQTTMRPFPDPSPLNQIFAYPFAYKDFNLWDYTELVAPYNWKGSYKEWRDVDSRLAEFRRPFIEIYNAVNSTLPEQYKSTFHTFKFGSKAFDVRYNFCPVVGLDVDKVEDFENVC